VRFNYAEAVKEKEKGIGLKEITCKFKTYLKKYVISYITMGRRRKGVINQGNKKNNKTGRLLPKEDRKAFCFGIKTPANQTFVYLPEEVLKALSQMDPRDVANILVNT